MTRFYLTLIAILNTLVINAQLVTFTPNDTLFITQNNITNGGDQVEALLYIENPTSQMKNMTWEKTEYTIPRDWNVYQVCDPSYCLTNNIFSAPHNFVVGPNSNGLFKVDLYQNCITGSGKIRVQLWERGDSANTMQYITLIYDLNSAANCNVTSLNEVIANNLKVYPNPAKDKITLEGLADIKNPRIEIINVIGSKVLNEQLPTQTNTGNIEISSMDRGIYFAKIYSGNKLITTRKFTKAD